MKLKYLGTAAYEGVPSLFCDCAVCRKSKRTGGKNLRSRSQALVNDDLLIDFPADTVWHSHAYGLDWNSITDCIITHSHSDHLYAADTAMLAEGYAQGTSKLHFYVGNSGFDKLAEVAERNGIGERMRLSRVNPFEKFTACHGRYTVLPLPADHAQNACARVVYYEHVHARRNVSFLRTERTHRDREPLRTRVFNCFRRIDLGLRSLGYVFQSRSA